MHKFLYILYKEFRTIEFTNTKKFLAFVAVNVAMLGTLKFLRPHWHQSLLTLAGKADDIGLVAEAIFLYTFTEILSKVTATMRRSIPRKNVQQFLKQNSLPQVFSGLEMLWTPKLRKEVWQPTFYDAEALYHELRKHSCLPMLNVIFTLKVVYMVVITGRIAVLDWSVSRLTNKRARLTGSHGQKRGKAQ